MSRRKRIPTAAEHAAFSDAWTEIAHGDAPFTPDPVAILRADAQRVTLRAASAEAEERGKGVGKDDAMRAAQAVARATRAKGTKNSADARRAKIAERNQRWREAHYSGKTPKQIHFDEPEVPGKKKVTTSTINRVLKRTSPP